LSLLARSLGAPSRLRLPPTHSRSPHPIRGSWEGAIPELGKQAGIFQKHGLDLDILYTQGGGETLQVVVSGAVDIGLSAGLLGSLGAYGKGAPIRIIGASSTGSGETFWWVAARSPLHSIRQVNGQTLAYSTNGSSSHIVVLRFISEYGLKARPVATGDSADHHPGDVGQVDVGWAVAPFVLDLLDKGEARMIARASDIAPSAARPSACRSPTRRTWRRRRTRSRAT
jgi:ABC-type nitrate/sulfonate/bicarbonate transport systems, periplasmic components